MEQNQQESQILHTSKDIKISQAVNRYKQPNSNYSIVKFEKNLATKQSNNQQLQRYPSNVILSLQSHYLSQLDRNSESLHKFIGNFNEKYYRIEENDNFEEKQKETQRLVIEEYWTNAFKEKVVKTFPLLLMFGSPQQAFAQAQISESFQKQVVDYEWVNPGSMPINMMSFVLQESAIVAALLYVLFKITNLKQLLDFSELQTIVTEQTGLKERDVNYIDKSDPETQIVNIKGTTKRPFKWAKDASGKLIVPDGLKKYVGVKDLKIMEQSETEDDESKNVDIFIFTIEGDDEHFQEAFMKVRVESGSSKFVEIPVISISQKEELSQGAIKQLISLEYAMNQIDEIIDGGMTTDPEEINRLKLVRYQTKISAQDLKLKIDNLQKDIESRKDLSNFNRPNTFAWQYPSKDANQRQSSSM